MTQLDVARAWWARLDEVSRRRVLRLRADDLLPEDLARDLALSGVTVIPLDASPVDGRPAGYVTPDVLLQVLQEDVGST